MLLDVLGLAVEKVYCPFSKGCYSLSGSWQGATDIL